MNTKLVLFLAIIVSIHLPAYSQLQYRSDSEGRDRGYSRTIGGKTYQFDSQGREIGYSQDLGGTTYNFNRQGKQTGYSQDLGGTIYNFGLGGREKGYYQDIGSGDEAGASAEESAAHDAEEPQVFDQGMGSSSYWGFSSGKPASDKK